MENNAIIDQLWNERQIKGVLLKFGRALDTGHWEDYRSCFTDNINVDFERLTGQPEVRVSADIWTRFADLFLTRVRRHHVYTNFDIRLNGDRAEAVVYMTARHWKATDRGVSHNTQYGWYDFSLERGSGEWLVSRVKHDFQWVDGNDALLEVHEPEIIAVMNQIFCEENYVRASGTTG